MSRPSQERQSDFLTGGIKTSIKPRTQKRVACRKPQSQQWMRSAGQLHSSRRCAIEVDEVGKPSIGQRDWPESNGIELKDYQVAKPVIEVGQFETRSTPGELLNHAGVKADRAFRIQTRIAQEENIRTESLVHLGLFDAGPKTRL